MSASPPTMLLPAAFPCDSSQHAVPRLQSALFASPPASPPTLSSHNAFGNIVSTCRSLQSLMTTMPSNFDELPSLAQLPTPPMAHAPSPMKLRLRSRPAPTTTTDSSDEHRAPRRRIAKRAPPRGVHKRRRGPDDDDSRERQDEEDVDSDLDLAAPFDADEQDSQQRQPTAPSTPKRARIAPEQLPLGLERADFHEMHLRDPALQQAGGADLEARPDGEEWSAEDDRILVELVLEKLKLSKSEWQDCARSLGKDRHSVGRRWKSLMAHGDVGVKTRSSSRRAKLHSTWR
ncbi:hypothetical protein HJFPF1_01482 [Paramyrothecium foliicola]|nr:hypothetical protein HJFPF1_01482 [Paramyrothecium foliicola]